MNVSNVHSFLLPGTHETQRERTRKRKEAEVHFSQSMFRSVCLFIYRIIGSISKEKTSS